MSTTHEEIEIRRPNFVFRFVKFIWGMVKGYFMMIGFLVTVLPLLIVFMISRSQSSSPIELGTDVKENSVIKLELNGQLTEKRPEPSISFLMRLLGEEADLYAPDFSNTLEFAAKDDRVKALYINIRRLSGNLAQLGELRRAIKQVKDAGKPVYFQVTDLDNATYYISSLGKEISLTPSGTVSITGPVLSMVYFADALKKIGVEFEVFRAGKYKSAMENLIRNEPSEESANMYNDLEDNIRKQMVEDLASARGVDVGLARGWLSQSIFIPKDALQAGILTQLKYENDFEQLIKDELKVDDFVKYSTYQSATGSLLNSEDMGPDNEKIALIEAVGEIHMHSDGSDNSITPGSMNKRLDWAYETDDVKAVVIRISSPGGSATASDMIWNRVRKLAEKKPVVVSMMGYAASGGYYIASGASKIISEPTTITGSIGVIGALANFSQFREKYGVSFHTFTGSERRSIYNPGEKMTAFDRALMSANIDSTYKDFLDRVARGRQMTVEEVHKIAQGRVWTGRQALEIGLVDELGGYQSAFQYAKEMGGLDPKKKYRIATYQKDELNFRECLRSSKRMIECFRELESKVVQHKFKSPLLKGVDLKQIERLVKYAENKKSLTLLPFTPEFK